MSATELPRPGVSVIQQFRTVSPTIVTPILVPCIVGASYQVVEAQTTDSAGTTSINSDAAVSVPPSITSSLAGLYTNLDGKSLLVSVNNGPDQEVVFSDPTAAGLSASQVRSQILATSGISGWAAYAVTLGGSSYIQLKGNTPGDGQTLKIMDGDANSDLGFPDFFEASGFSSYTQDKRYIAQGNFPDPNDNIDELDVDEDSIRVFVNTGSQLSEMKRDQTFLRNGHVSWIQSSAISFPTSSLDAKTLQLTFVYGGVEQVITFDGDFYDNDGTLVVPGIAYADPGTDTIEIQKNNDTPVTVTFASPADIDAAITAINAAWAGTYAGEDVAYRALSDGSPDGAGTFIAFQVGGATATGDIVKVIEPAAGDAFVDVGFVSGSGSMGSSLVYFINQTLSSPDDYPAASAVVDGVTDYLKLWSYDGYLKIDKDGTANASLGFSTSADTEQYSLQGVDDGDGDTKSPIIRIHNEDFTIDPTGAELTGTADLSGEVYLHKMTFQVALDGQPMQEIEFNGGPIVADLAAGAFPGTWDTQVLIMEVNGTTKTVTFSSPADLDDVVNQINTAAGQPVVYRSDSVGAYSASGTYLSFQVGGSTDAGGEIELTYTGSTAWTNIGFSSTADEQQVLTSSEIEAAVEATLGAGSAAIVSNNLVLSSAEYGDESKIEIGQGSANATLGFTDNDVSRGSPFKPKSGDYVYADGEFLGIVSQVTPGAVKTDIRLDREYSFSTLLKKSWYMEAMNIPDTLPSDRPTPDLVVDLAGDVTLKHDYLRDTRGEPINSANDQIILAYKALRLDVSPKASNPSLLTFEDTDELETALAPLDTDNPLGLGLFLALLNAPGVTVSAIGVDAVSADSPFGTLEAFSRTMSFLQSKEVYAIAPLTHESVVNQAWQVHVNEMSEPDSRGERVVIINPDMPDRELDTLIGSGTDGDSTGITNEFDSKLTSLASALLAAGIDPSLPIPVSSGVYLDIATDAKRYNISALSGTKLTINVTFAPGENDDLYYSSTNLPNTLISESFSVKVRGAELLDSDGNPDYDAISETYADLGRSFGDRRVVMTAPDQCAASINGLEQIIDGFYMNAAIAGMVGQQRPQQGFTNFPMAGLTRVIGSTGVFSETQMNKAAAGGVYWIIQEVANGPLTCRHQLTTDLTSVETREFSITKDVDFCAKFMRSGLRNFIGKFNITQPFLDTLTTVIQGQLSFLAENGVILGGELNNIIQDTDNPDTVIIDVTIDVPYPCNYIRLTLIV